MKISDTILKSSFESEFGSFSHLDLDCQKTDGHCFGKLTFYFFYIPEIGLLFNKQLNKTIMNKNTLKSQNWKNFSSSHLGHYITNTCCCPHNE